MLPSYQQSQQQYGNPAAPPYAPQNGYYDASGKFVPGGYEMNSYRDPSGGPNSYGNNAYGNSAGQGGSSSYGPPPGNGAYSTAPPVPPPSKQRM
jgi:hypothetical protein